MKPVSVLWAILIVALSAGVVSAWTPDKSRADLEAKYLRSPGDIMEVAGIQLHVRDQGPRDAPAVILLHGFGSSLHTFESWAEALSADHRVVRFDMPGTALSGPDPASDYTDGRSLAVLAALMDRLGLAKASLVGHSMGGRIAWRFAAERPERVDKLVLIAPDGFASPGAAYGERQSIPAMARLMRYALPRSMLRMALVPAYADAARLTEDTVTRYHDLLLAPGARAAMLVRMGQMELVDPVPLLRRITAPTLLLWGREDAMIPVANGSDYLAALPNGTLVVLSDLGHVPHEEAPDLSLPPVRAFLSASSGKQSSGP